MKRQCARVRRMRRAWPPVPMVALLLVGVLVPARPSWALTPITFGSPSIYNLSASPEGIAAADLDGDGNQDIAVDGTKKESVGKDLHLTVGTNRQEKVGQEDIGGYFPDLAALGVVCALRRGYEQAKDKRRYQGDEPRAQP